MDQGEYASFGGISIRLYPLADAYPPFGSIISTIRFRAMRTGEYRQPKAGEWYLNGAIPQAYRALHNTGTSFHILRIVQIKKIEVIEIVKPMPNEGGVDDTRGE